MCAPLEAYGGATAFVYPYGYPTRRLLRVSGRGSPLCTLCCPLAEGTNTGEYTVPPPKSYSPFGLVPKYVVSRLRRASVPHFTVCRAVVQAKFNCNWNKFPNPDITEPAALLYASYRPSLNLRAGSVWFGVTNEGVVRVKLNDVDQTKRGDTVRVYVMTPFRCRSTYCTPKFGL